MKKLLIISLLIFTLLSSLAINAETTAQDKLIAAAAALNMDDMLAALDAGADVNGKDAAGRTALMEACRADRSTPALMDLDFTIMLLLASGADPNITAYYPAVSGEDYPLYALLNANFTGDTAADQAKYFPELITKLTEAKASANCQSKDLQKTPLHAAAITNNAAAADYLIRMGGKVANTDTTGKTPLHYAAAANNLDVAKVLLSGKADVNAKDNNGQSPLDLASSEEMKALLK